MTSPIRVLYVIGKGRSGSTLFDRLLGGLQGAVSTGELWKLWQRGVLGQEPCGCGTRLLDCEFWAPVLGPPLRGQAEHIEALRAKELRWGRLPWLINGRHSPGYLELAETFAELYRRIQQQSGANVIIDSSKWPLHPGLLGDVPGVEPYAVLLLRHPYAVAHSWQRKKKYHGSSTQQWMKQFPAWHSGLSWSLRAEVSHMMLRRLGDRALWMRYEDLMASPKTQLERVRALLKLDASLDYVQGHTVQLGLDHTVGGNPNRFDDGAIKLRADTEWREHLVNRDRQQLRLITAATRRRFGYRDR